MSNPSQTNQYDKIVKENIDVFLPALIESDTLINGLTAFFNEEKAVSPVRSEHKSRKKGK